MTGPVGLVAFAALIGFAGPRLLDAATWTTRSPVLGILAWQVLTASTFLSLVLAGAFLAAPAIPAAAAFVAIFHDCALTLKEHYATSENLALTASGGLLALILLGRLAFQLVKLGHRSRRDRARQQDLLELVCHPHGEPGVVVVEHPEPTVFCFPGRRQQIVVTRGALTLLTDEQLHQVLIHERAHLRARHHVALLAGDAMAAALSGRLGSDVASRRIAELAEMHADDATDPSKRRDLASALVVLADGATPAGAMGVTGEGCALRRVRRLVLPEDPVSVRQRVGVWVLGLGALATPVLIAAAPAAAVAVLNFCPDLSV